MKKFSFSGWLLPALLIVAVFIFIRPFKNFFYGSDSPVNSFLGGKEASKNIEEAGKKSGLDITQVHKDVAGRLQGCLDSFFFSEKDFLEILQPYFNVVYVNSVPYLSDVNYYELACIYTAFGMRKLWFKYPFTEGSNTLIYWINKVWDDDTKEYVIKEFTNALKKYDL